MTTDINSYAAQIAAASIREAIESAIASGHSIGKHADPTEGERVGLTVEEAVEVAHEDVSLLYVEN